MGHRAALILILGVVVSGLTDRTAIGNARGEGTPAATPGQAIGVAILGQTVDLAGTGLEHRLLRVTIPPDLGIFMTDSADSLLLAVERGTIRLTTTGDATIATGLGEPIRSSDEVVCSSVDGCPLAAGQTVTLGPGNTLSLRDGTIDVDSTGPEPAVLGIAVVGESPARGCWICPKPS